MAFVSKEDKKALTPAIKAVCAKHGYKVSLSIWNSSSLIAKIKNAESILKGYCEIQQNENKLRRREINGYDNFSSERVMQEAAKWGHTVNEYWIEDNYCEKGIAFLNELKEAMEGPDFFCEDDIMTDYFHRSHWIEIQLYAKEMTI